MSGSNNPRWWQDIDPGVLFIIALVVMVVAGLICETIQVLAGAAPK